MTELTNGDRADPLEVDSKMKTLAIQRVALTKKEEIYLWEPRPMPDDFGREPIPVRSRPSKHRRSKK